MDPAGRRPRPRRQEPDDPNAGSHRREAVPGLEIRAELGRKPTSVEIGKDVDFTPEEVERLWRLGETPSSLEQRYGDEDDSELGQFLTDETQLLPEELVEVIRRKDVLAQMLATLPPRQREILELRFGIGGRARATLDELGRQFNVSRERIRQIERQALMSLHAQAKRETLSQAS